MKMKCHKRFNLRSVCFHLVFLLAIGTVHSQEWSEPQVISTGGFNVSPDFVIDKSHIIHCVWSKELSLHFRKIFYSHSTDNGNTWSVPMDISLNKSLWMDLPHIVSNSVNHLHVVYDYNVLDYSKTKICYIFFNGSNWSEPLFLSDTMPGAMHNRIAIDHNNRVYCFWYYRSIIYRTLDNGSWSGDFQPYVWDHDMFFLNRVLVGKQNDLYCIGYHYYKNENSYDDHAIGFSMNNGVWSNFTELSDTLSWENNDLGLISDSLPVYLWGQLRRDTSISQTATFLAEMTPSGLTEPLMISKRAREVAIATDINGHVHIADSEQISDTVFQLVCYYQNGDIWNKKILQTGPDDFRNITLKSDSNNVFLIYQRTDVASYPPVLSIVFSKLEVIPAVIKKNEFNPFEVFPNPFTGHLTISLICKEKTYLEVLLKDLIGRVVYTVFRGESTPGSMTYCLNTRNLKKMNLKPGIYFIQIRLGENVSSKKVIWQL